MKAITILAALSFLTVPLVQAKKINVQIVDRKESGTEFTVSYPGYAQSNCTGWAYSNQAQVNCSEINAPAQTSSYNIQGYLLTLRLPDDRLVLITCEKKTNWSEWNTHWYRSCRHPLTEAVEADFSGDNAKLEWPISLDGKKKQRETYKIVAVLGRIQDPASKAKP